MPEPERAPAEEPLRERIVDSARERSDERAEELGASTSL
jgi:hypothetical protein